MSSAGGLAMRACAFAPSPPPPAALPASPAPVKRRSAPCDANRGRALLQARAGRGRLEAPHIAATPPLSPIAPHAPLPPPPPSSFYPGGRLPGGPWNGSFPAAGVPLTQPPCEHEGRVAKLPDGALSVSPRKKKMGGGNGAGGSLLLSPFSPPWQRGQQEPSIHAERGMKKH